MSTIDKAKTATKQVLDTIAGIDPLRVYTRQRELTSDKVCKEILMGSLRSSTNTFINAWMISCIGFEDDMMSIGTTGFNKRVYQVQILGYYGMNENAEPSSEEAFELLCEAISDGIANDIRAYLPPSSHIVDFPKFDIGYSYIPMSDGVLVHDARAVFTLDIWHQRS